MSRYLRKVDGTIICRDDNQPVTDIASHRAQWHSLSPKPSLDGMSSSSTRITETLAPIQRWAWTDPHGPMEIR